MLPTQHPRIEPAFSRCWASTSRNNAARCSLPYLQSQADVLELLEINNASAAYVDLIEFLAHLGRPKLSSPFLFKVVLLSQQDNFLQVIIPRSKVVSKSTLNHLFPGNGLISRRSQQTAANFAQISDQNHTLSHPTTLAPIF